jgi:hypothetical protein
MEMPRAPYRRRMHRMIGRREVVMAKKYKVGFKTINAKLKVTKHHLNKIKKHVIPSDQKKITAQIVAIDLIIAACGKTHMSAFYTGK